MNETIFNSFLNVVYTTSDAEEIENAIMNALREYYRITRNDLLTQLSQSLSKTIFEELELLLQHNNIINSNQEVIKSFLERLLEALHHTSIVTLTITEPLSYKMTQTLAELTKERYGSNTIIEISFDPTLIAGAIITYNGQYIDNSLHNRVKKYLEETINTSPSKKNQ